MKSHSILSELQILEVIFGIMSLQANSDCAVSSEGYVTEAKGVFLQHLLYRCTQQLIR